MELACEMFVVGDRERQGVWKEEEREGKMGGKKGMKEERIELRQMERMEDI
jgi:squalene cyclase